MTLFNIRQTADKLNVSYKALWYRLRCGDVGCTTKVGCSRLFDEETIEELRCYFNKGRDRNVEITTNNK